MLYRYAGAAWRGPVLLCASILDVLVYAVALSLVVETVFQLQGADRFVLMLIGLISLRWTLSCSLQASRVAHFAEICGPYYRRPILATMILSLGSPTFVFFVSAVLLVFAIVLTVHTPDATIHMLGWGLFIALIHLSWNSLLVLAVIQARRRGYLTSEVPIVLGFVLVLIISPVAYQFADIPDAASRVLTSFNPASHLLAGYQNAFWYLQDISLEVLPLSALLAVVTIVLLVSSVRRIPEPSVERPDVAPICLAWNGHGWSRVAEPTCRNVIGRFIRWNGELPWLTVTNLVYLIDRAGNKRNVKSTIFSALASAMDNDRLMGMPLPLLSQSNRNRLCVALALGSRNTSSEYIDNVVRLRKDNEVEIILDGLLDHAELRELLEFSSIVQSRNLDSVLVLTYRRRTAEILSNTPHKRNIGLDLEH